VIVHAWENYRTQREPDIPQAFIELLAEVQAAVADVRTALHDVAVEVVGARERQAAERERADRMERQLAELYDQVPTVLRALVTEEAANRRRLEQLRRAPDYARSFDEPDPLVTVSIPTHDRVELLTERALPSVLAQTYPNLDVLVVGDRSPPRVAEAVERIRDERVRFVNLTHRHAFTDPERHWLVGSVPGRNAGYEHARGAWIVDFDDDDEMRPHAIESVLTKAREERLEVVYGKLLKHEADDRTEVIGRFPPAGHQFSWQGAAVHGGLRFLGRDSVAAAFGHPNDWFRAETMMRIGVRFGMVDEIVYDYYPARAWERTTPIPEEASIPEPEW